MEDYTNRELLVNVLTDRQFSLEKYLFHSFPIEENAFKNIILDGIKCKYLLGYRDNENSYNGSYYVSTFKMTDKKVYPLCVLEKSPLLIVSDEIGRLKTKMGSSSIFSDTIIPLRVSPYENEYQTFLKINSKNIIGIAYYLCDTDPALLEKIKILKLIIKWLGELEKQMLIVNSYNNMVINQEKVKSLLLG